jgi:uncharacterized cofD-like protein
MQLKELDIGCFGGGTGLPSLLGGLKRNPWLRLHAVVTMFDSGGSSGVLRDELGVLPPGDVLKCALALARNEAEARRVLLSRLPTLAAAGSSVVDARLAGHTGGNLLLSMMEQYSGDFLAAVDGLRRLLGCSGHVWPVSTDKATLCAVYQDKTSARGEPEVDAGQREGRIIERVFLDPSANIHPSAAAAIRKLDAIIIGPGSFYTSLMPTCLVRGVRETVGQVRGPVIMIANLLTEGSGMRRFTAADGARLIAAQIGRPVDVIIFNTARPPADVLERYAAEDKHPLPLGQVVGCSDVIGAPFWTGTYARHHRRRLAYAIWGVLAKRLLH